MVLKTSGDRDGGAPPPSRLSEYLLYAAICMLGMPVEVQVKDGSLYSGVLHTASFDEGHGIVLKKARKVGRGKNEKGFPMGSLIDTLVVFSADLVQVVVKDFLLPGEGVVGDISRTTELQTCADSESDPRLVLPGDSDSFSSGMVKHTNEEEMSPYELNSKDTKIDPVVAEQKMVDSFSNINQGVEAVHTEEAVELPHMPTASVQESQAGEEVPEGKPICENIGVTHGAKDVVHEEHPHLHPHNASLPQLDNAGDSLSSISSKRAPNETRRRSPGAGIVWTDDHPESKSTNSSNYASLRGEISTTSSHSSSVSDSRASSCGRPVVSPSMAVSENNPSSKPSNKEFKLNPRAKIFSPMSTNSRLSPTTVPNVTNVNYVPSVPPIVPISAAQSGIELNSFASRPAPAKLVQYDSLLTGYGNFPAQYSRPAIGNANAWQQPVRLSGQYQPLQAGAAYVHPTPQTAVVGRTGQLVYVHPVGQDVIQAVPSFSQGAPYPMLNHCQTNLPKVQGAVAPPLQFCVAPPLVTGVTQPFAMPARIPFSQPFPAVRPILVPGGNGHYGSKFQ